MTYSRNIITLAVITVALSILTTTQVNAANNNTSTQKNPHVIAPQKIGSYEVRYTSNGSNSPPTIWLKSSNKSIGELIFGHNGSALPPDNIVNGLVILHYHLEDYENVLDLLRNVHDTPVYLDYTGSGSAFNNGILTSSELAGGG